MPHSSFDANDFNTILWASVFATCVSGWLWLLRPDLRSAPDWCSLIVQYGGGVVLLAICMRRLGREFWL
jgi:hypothetical protein